MRKLTQIKSRNGVFLKMFWEVAMGFLLWIVCGLVIGPIAKFIIPSKDSSGMIVTILLGIGGAVIGGVVATVIWSGTITGFNDRSPAIPIGVALILLFGYRLVVTQAITACEVLLCIARESGPM